jgi:hypothetical protein
MSLSFSSFDGIPGIRYGFSERSDGSLRLNQPTTEEHRRRYLEMIGIPFESLVSADLVHGKHVHVARASDAGKTVSECDGLVTNARRLTLTVTGADCFPIFAVDPLQRVIGLVHAGWRGIAAGIAAELVSQMRGLGSEKQGLLFGIGPGIRACHFEVQDDVVSVFPDREAIIHEGETTRIDLPAAIKRQLHAAGIALDQIEDGGLCTYCETERYFSRRRERGGELQAMMAHLMLE